MAIYFFDKNQTLIKIVPENATFEAIQTQELDDDSLLKDTLSVTVKGDEKLLNAEYMAVKSYTGNAQTFDMYRIVTDTTPDKSMSFTGMSLAPYELNGHIIQDLRPTNQTISYTLNRVLDGTDWHVGYIEDGLSNVTTTFYYVSAKEALKELQSLVGCEFVFKVEISGQKITDKWIEVYSEMGNRTKKRFNYGTNALTIVRETNKADIYTALIGRGKGEEVSSGEDNESGQAGYGRKITFEDIEWSIANGNPLNKPKGQYYLELPQATQVYGIKNIDGTIKARVGIVDFDDEEDKNRLINLTYQQLLVSSRPKVLFKTTVANIGATGIGDTVTIHRHDLNIHYQTRVRKIVRNKLNDNKTQIELGDAVVTPSTKRDKQNNATIKNLNQELERVKADVTTSQISADGKNTIFYGSSEPTRKRTGDTWYRPHPSIAGETQMLVWNGTAWELVIDTSDLTSVSREVQDAISKAEEAKSLAVSEAESALAQAKADATAKANAIQEQISGEVNTAITTAEDAKALAVSEAANALTQAKEDATVKVNAIQEQISGEVNTAISTAEDAKALAVSEAEQALIDAKAHAEAGVQASKEHFDGLIAATQSDVSNAQATADSAVEQIDTAVANAGFTSLDETIRSMNDIASGVKNELDIAIENAGFTSLADTLQNMNDIASGVKSELDMAVQNAGFTSLDEVVSDTRHLGETANSNAQTAISEAQAAQANSLDALGKADNALDGVSNLDIRVDDVEAELELKADSTFMTEDGTLTTLSNAITFNANRFSSDMQRIESRVESLSGEINLVILSDAFEGTRLVGGESYPNPSTGSGYNTSDTMREMIAVEEGEQLALSKNTVNIGYNWWTYNYYDDNYNYIGRSGTSNNEYILTVPNGVSRLWVSYPKGSQPQIVRGTTFVPYRPNLADQMTTDEIRIFRNEYDEFAEGTQRRITAIDGEGGRLETAETLINQTAEGLSTTVGKLDSQESRISTVEQTASGLQATVSDKASITQVTQIAEGLDVLVKSKPKNVINNGDFSDGYVWWSFGTNIAPKRIIENRLELDLTTNSSATSGNLNRIWNVPQLQSGKKYRVTFDAYTYTSGRAISVGQASSQNMEEVVLSNEVRSYEVIFEADRNASLSIYFHVAGTYEIGNIVVVETSAISRAQISVLSDSITSTISTLDGRVSEQKQTIEGISSTVYDEHADKIATQQLTIDGLQNTVASKAGQTEVTQLATGLNALVQNKPKSIALNGDFSNGRSYWTFGTGIDFYTVEENRVRVWLSSSNQSTSGNANRIFNNGRFLSGRKYRVTFDAFGAFGSTSITTKDISVGQSDSTRNQKVTITETLQSYEVIYHADRNGPISFYLHDWGQYEIGNIEVVETNQISQAQISVLSDSITSTISTLDGRVSEQEQTLGSISSTVYDEHADKIATQQLTIDGLQNTVASKAGQTEVTQLATGLNALVQNKPKSIALNGDFSIGSNGRSYWTMGTGIEFYTIEENRARVWLHSSSQSTSGNVNRMFNNGRFLSGRKYRVTFDAFGAFGATTTKEISVGQSESARNQKVTLTETLQSYEIIYHADRNGPISFYLHDWGQYEIGNVEVVETNQISQAQISVLNNNINLRVSKGELLSQINIEAERTLIQSNKLVLDSGSVVFTGEAFIPSGQIESLHASKIKSGTIDSDRIDAEYIVANGLTTDVVKSTHIESSTGLIDKIFANEALITRLTSNSIFASKIKAINIDASKITTGELDAARIKSKDVVTQGLTTDVVKSTHIESSTGLIDKIFANEALITRLTSNSIFASKIKAIEIDASKITSGELDSALIDAEYIVTNGLSANVVESTHIKAEAGLVGKIFSKTAYIEELTNKTVFTEKIQAINISADKITTGTLDAGKVKVINIDAENITSNKTSFIQSSWNDIESSIRIDGSGLLSTASDGSQVYLQNGIVGARNPDGATIGQIGYVSDGSTSYTVRTSWGTHFQIRTNRDGQADKRAFYIGSGGTETHIETNNIYLKPSSTGAVRVEGNMFVTKSLSVSNEIYGANKIRFTNGAYLEEQANGNTQLKSAGTQLQFYQASGRIMYSEGTRLLLDLPINMQGNGIFEQSDERIKTDIKPLEMDSLNIIQNVDYKSFTMIKNDRKTFGFIAQQMQDLAPNIIHEQDGLLTYDSMEYTHLIGHALQKHVIKTNDEISKLKAQIVSLQDELALLKGD